MQLGDVLRKNAAGFTDADAVIAGDRRQSFGELYERACRLADALTGLGLESGDRVCIVEENRLDWFERTGALALAGLVRCTLSGRDSVETHLYKLNAVGARALLISAEHLAPLAARLAEAPSVKHVVVHDGESEVSGWALVHRYEDLIAGHSPHDPHARWDRDDIFQIQFSAGTTGKAKGVCHTAGGWSAVTTEFSLMLPELTEQDRYLVAGPIGHSGGIATLSFMAVGAAQVVMPAFSVPEALSVIPRERITATLLVPTMINMIVNHPDARAADLSSLRAVIYAAAPISERTLSEALSLWGDIMIQSYGQSEGLPSTVLRPRDYVNRDADGRRRRLRSAGRPTPNTVIRILGEDGRELGLGEVGEIVVGSPCVMAGLWEDPERTAERMTERGEVRTRDMGYLDEDGFLYLADRKEDLIITGGFNVWPAEIEDALMAHEAVLEAAVVGVPDPKWGETPKAVVVLRDGHSASADELIAYCRDRLGGVKKPTEVVFQDRPLAKSAAGKIQRRALREEYWPLEDPAWIAGA